MIDNRNGHVATKTGNTYISGTITDRMTVPTANMGLLTMPNSKILTPDDCDNDRQPEMVKCGPKPEILNLWNYDRITIPTANLGFSTTPSAKN